MPIGVIADDLTGATDVALMFARGGLRVIQQIGVPQSPMPPDAAQAIVVALKTRTVPAPEAIEQSLAALSFLEAAGATQVLFKYCSTFDSTAAGNIGPVIDALLEALGEKCTIACPAMPANGRTVYQGHLFVGDRLLSESSMKDHPLTPMRDANLLRVLRPQTHRPVSLIPHGVVRAGSEALERAFAATDGIAIVDALDEADLRRIGHAARTMRLVTGASGIALGLSGNVPERERQAVPSPVTPASGGAVTLAGSCSAATRRQIAFACRAGAPAMRITPAAIAVGELTVAEVAGFVRKARGSHPPIVYSAAEPTDVAAAQRELGRESAGSLIEAFLANVARALLADGTTRFIIAGGETSGAVVRALGVRSLAIGPEIDPGVPWASFSARGRTIAIALKSGNFGADDFFLKAWAMLP